MQRLDTRIDPIFANNFRVEVEEQLELQPGGQGQPQPNAYATVFCKHCPRSWDVQLDHNGQVPKGACNSLTAHATTHDPLYRPKFRAR